ncbi:auxin response factor 3-like isoform X2 [Solanum dulcamara]|uniref:auxin response factor 3-like isoform X2 n=1 Tax=Solanum dulcamara TaxID=45834 RepID=UPI00248677BE|nr:auxin response factor 3-like isoform X2 [Solanum dulcamara]
MTSVSLDSPASAASGSLDLTLSTPSPAVASVCMELWHVCDGPLILLPKKGSVVVYLPQGHLKHLYECLSIAYNLLPNILSRFVDVKLQADETSDEVYVQVSLAPDNQRGSSDRE